MRNKKITYAMKGTATMTIKTTQKMAIAPALVKTALVNDTPTTATVDPPTLNPHHLLVLSSSPESSPTNVGGHWHRGRTVGQRLSGIGMASLKAVFDVIVGPSAACVLVDTSKLFDTRVSKGVSGHRD